MNDYHELDINKLARTIAYHKDIYRKVYEAEPRYLKIPEWAYVYLEKQFSNDLVQKPQCAPITWYSLELCPTKSISELGDIEVF